MNYFYHKENQTYYSVDVKIFGTKEFLSVSKFEGSRFREVSLYKEPVEIAADMMDGVIRRITSTEEAKLLLLSEDEDVYTGT